MSSFQFHIIAKTANWIAIEKPRGFHVHKPENLPWRVPKEIICLPLLRRQIGQYVYPIHRLDVGTSGVLLFALHQAAAAALNQQFRESLVQKKYWAIVRGFTPPSGVVDDPLESDSTGEAVAAYTEIETFEQVELPFAVGKRHPTARYSWIEARPRTGRYHQIRRHLARRSHPIVGDREHGDTHQNRFFREQFDLHGLWLKAHTLIFNDPISATEVHLRSPQDQIWEKMATSLGFAGQPLPSSRS